jgi:hypothetical protein
MDRFSNNTPISNFIKIGPVGAQLFHADGGTDIRDKANSRFLQKRLQKQTAQPATLLLQRKNTERRCSRETTIYFGKAHESEEKKHIAN